MLWRLKTRLKTPVVVATDMAGGVVKNIILFSWLVSISEHWDGLNKNSGKLVCM